MYNCFCLPRVYLCDESTFKHRSLTIIFLSVELLTDCLVWGLKLLILNLILHRVLPLFFSPTYMLHPLKSLVVINLVSTTTPDLLTTFFLQTMTQLKAGISISSVYTNREREKKYIYIQLSENDWGD